MTAPQHRNLPIPLRMNYEAPVVPSKSNPKSILQYLERVYATISRCGVHGHFPICHEGKSGLKGCRLSYEQPLQECTDVCQLDAGLTPPENTQSPTDQAPQPLQECTDVSQFDTGLTPPENIQTPTDHAPSTRMGCGTTRLEKDYSLQPLPTRCT